jgi:hypothetical protein
MPRTPSPRRLRLRLRRRHADCHAAEVSARYGVGELLGQCPDLDCPLLRSLARVPGRPRAHQNAVPSRLPSIGSAGWSPSRVVTSHSGCGRSRAGTRTPPERPAPSSPLSGGMSSPVISPASEDVPDGRRGGDHGLVRRLLMCLPPGPPVPRPRIPGGQRHTRPIGTRRWIPPPGAVPTPLARGAVPRDRPARRRRPGLLHPPGIQRPDRSDQRPPRSAAPQRPRLPQPDQLPHPIPTPLRSARTLNPEAPIPPTTRPPTRPSTGKNFARVPPYNYRLSHSGLPSSARRRTA